MKQDLSIYSLFCNENLIISNNLYFSSLRYSDLLLIQDNLYIQVIQDASSSLKNIICDRLKKAMIIVNYDKNKEKWIVDDRFSHIEIGILDLDNTGKRWVGGIHFSSPFGYGELYDENNVLRYAGFYFDGTKVCYGCEFSSTGLIEYDGGFYNGNRHGIGKLYDLKGKVEYCGQWICGTNELSKSIIIDTDYGFIHNILENITINSNSCFSILVLDFSFFNSLKQLEIQSNSCQRSGGLVFTNCKSLESIFIGTNSFLENTDYAFRIEVCPNLKSIVVENNSFRNTTGTVVLRSKHF